MAKMTVYRSGVLWSYARAVFQYAGVKGFVFLALLITLGLAEGIGLLMIIPFLQLMGVGGGEGSGGLTAFIGGIMAAVRLPLTLPALLGAYTGIVTGHAVAARFKDVLNVEIVQGFTQFLRDRLYGKLMRVDWLSFTRTRAADVTHVLTSGLEMVGYGTQQLLLLIGTAVIVVVHIGVALTISPPLTALALGSGAVLLLVLRPFNRQAFRTGEALYQARNEMFATVTEHLNGMKVAKSYGVEQRHVQYFGVVTGELVSQFIRFARINAGTRMFYQIGAVLLLSAFLYWAIGVFHLPAPFLLLMAFLFARILPKLSLLQQCQQQIRNVLPSYEAALAMEKRFAEIQEPLTCRVVAPVRLGQGVEFRQVSFCYHQNKNAYALHQIDLVIPGRRTTAIVGPSGAGKSTLADLLMGLLPPDQGTVLIDGLPLAGERLQGWRQSVGYVPQETFLFHDTIRANLQWAQPAAGEEDLWRVLHLAAAAEFVGRLPQGLDTVVGDRGVRLSGGERQRLALARALLRQPSLLLLDEATSSLDLENERQIQEAVRQLAGELTIVVIAHRLSTIRGADRIVVLNHGRVVESGTWDQLAARPGGLFRSLVQMEVVPEVGEAALGGQT
jgi:ATP-binding cassette subfamily C protein